MLLLFRHGAPWLLFVVSVVFCCAGCTGDAPIDGSLPVATTPVLCWEGDALGATDSPVAAWPDSSGMGNDGSQTNSDRQPIVATDANSWQKVARFDGEDDYLTFTTKLTNIRTVFWVVSERWLGSDGLRFLLGSDDTDDFYRYAADVLWEPFYAATGISDGATWLNGALVDGTQTLLPSDELCLVALRTTEPVTAGNFSLDRNEPDRVWNGDLAALIIYDVPLSDSEITEITQNLAQKYQITLAP
ncbi:MAG: hypothetical protein ACYC7E_00500 [Armatimonadota bacterium]